MKEQNGTQRYLGIYHNCAYRVFGSAGMRYWWKLCAPDFHSQTDGHQVVAAWSLSQSTLCVIRNTAVMRVSIPFQFIGRG